MCALSPPAAALCTRPQGRQGQDNHPGPDLLLKQGGQDLTQEEYLRSVSPELPAVSAATEVVLKMLISTALLIMGLTGGFF